MSDFQLKTPVAFLIFKRPDTTEKVFEAIRQAKPPKLLVVADGPRPDQPGEAEKCSDTRAIIDRVDWNCEVLKNYSDVNMGCKLRVSSGLNWVFDNVEETIILEDDCVPHPSFFQFCEELLNLYRDDTRIMHIGGNNYGILGENDRESYYFSGLTPVWGWATWKRAWRFYDVNLSFWPTLKNASRFWQMFDEKEAKYRCNVWEKVHAGKIDSWAYGWYLTCLVQGGLAIVPNKNLISNIGCGLEGTHTLNKNHHFANLNVKEIEFPLVHPQFFIRDRAANKMYFKLQYDRPIITRINRKLKKIIAKV